MLKTKALIYLTFPSNVILLFGFNDYGYYSIQISFYLFLLLAIGKEDQKKEIFNFCFRIIRRKFFLIIRNDNLKIKK